MQATKQFLQAWKHDIMAGSFAVLAMVLLLQLMSRGSGPVAAEIPTAASPASFGIVTETDDTPDTLARAGEIEQHANAQPSPTDDTEEQPTEQAVQEVMMQDADSQQEEANQTVANDDIAAATESTETENASSDAELVENTTPQEDKAAQLPQQTEDEQVAKAADQPRPNDVEAKPKPVEKMTAEEITEAVAAYEQRVRNGEVRLVLEWVLTADQLNSVVAYYVVGTKHTTITIAPGGLVNYITEAGIPKGKLMGDLPPHRGKWPLVVVSKARNPLGGNYVARTASFVLSDATALKLYRTLAHQVGTNKRRPGSVFVLRLFAVSGQIQVKLIRHESSPRAVES